MILRCKFANENLGEVYNFVVLPVRRNTTRYREFQIDILVNNAGRSQRCLAVNASMEVDRQMMELNTLSVMSLTKYVLLDMIKRRSGHVVVTSSVAGKIGKMFR